MMYRVDVVILSIDRRVPLTHPEKELIDACQEGARGTRPRSGYSAHAACRPLKSAKETLVRAGMFSFRDRRARAAISAGCSLSGEPP
jgi:hypothetical protein